MTTMNSLCCLVIISWFTCSTQGRVHTNNVLLRVKRQTGAHKVVCYVPSWAAQRTGDGRYTVEDLDPQLCTHVIYTYVKIIENDLDLDLSLQGAYSDLSKLKKHNPDVKTMISVGGMAMTFALSSVAESESKKSEFSANVVEHLRAHSLDGLDVDWRPIDATDRESFLALLQELSRRFADEAEVTGRPRLLMSATLSADSHVIDNIYDLPIIDNYIDFGNVMAFDFLTGWTGRVTLHSALYGQSAADIYNQDWVVQKYLAGGFTAEKLILGIPTYGKTFTLCDFLSTDLGSCSKGQGLPGWITGAPGTAAFYEVCVNIDNHWNQRYSDTQHGAFIFLANQWISFENVKSITAKVEYIEAHSLGGVMIWDVSLDDFRGTCGQGSYPLANAARNRLIPTTTTVATTSSSEYISTTNTTTTRSALFNVPTRTVTISELNYSNCVECVNLSYICVLCNILSYVIWKSLLKYDNNLVALLSYLK